MTGTLARTRRGTCTYCSKPVLWAVSKNDKPMPIDPSPYEDGNVELVHEAGGVVRALVVPKGKQPGLFDNTARFKAHFATCSRR